MSAISLVLVTLLAQLPPPANDVVAKAEARNLLSEGSVCYEAGAYADALAKFNAAYAAFPSPKLLFNIGQANRALGRPVEALQAFESFLRDADDASAKGMEDARLYVDELRRQLGRIVVHCDTTLADVSVDGKNVGKCPLADPIWAIPGTHQVTASKADYAPSLENVEVKDGATSVASLRLRVLTPPRANPPLRALGWSAAGLGVAGIGVGIATGLVAWSEKNDLSRRCPQNHCPPENHSALARYNNLKLASTIGFAAGGACLVTGVIVLLATPAGEKPAEPKVAFGIGPRFAQMRIRF
jgi:hypothetical protein